jgi:hypothetical protein
MDKQTQGLIDKLGPIATQLPMFHALTGFGSLEPLTAAYSLACNENVICIMLKSPGFASLATEIVAHNERGLGHVNKQPRPSNLIAKSRSNSNSTRNLLLFETATEKLF